MRFLKIGGGAYDVDVIAFIRKLRKPVRTQMTNGHVVLSEYVVHLKSGYHLDTKKKSSAIFIGRREAEGIVTAIGLDIKDLDEDLAGTPEDPAQQPDVGED